MKVSLSSRIFDIFNIVLMLLLIVVTLYPVLYVFSASVSNPTLVQSGMVKLLPKGWTWIAYERILSRPDLWISYWNTVRYTVVQTVLSLVATSMMAYPLARRILPGKRFLLLMIAFTMLFSGGLIPSFLVVQKLGMLNTIWALVIPGLISTWHLFIMRTFFEALPSELEDAATIDGCGPLGVLGRIVLPLSAPVMVTIGLYTVVGQWNSFFDALLYLSERNMYPLQILMRTIIIVGNTSDSYAEDDGTFVETVKYSLIVISTLPILCIYPFIQKYFVQGSMIGGIKG
jgi:putative aldouronate transport system permease protein